MQTGAPATAKASSLRWKILRQDLLRKPSDIQQNIDANSKAFGDTRVKSMMLHWNQNEKSNISSTFDLIVASDCTFFKEFHNGLAQLVKFLLEKVWPSEAVFFSPKRGDSLDKFLDKIKESNLSFSITDNYDA